MSYAQEEFLRQLSHGLEPYLHAFRSNDSPKCWSNICLRHSSCEISPQIQEDKFVSTQSCQNTKTHGAGIFVVMNQGCEMELLTLSSQNCCIFFPCDIDILKLSLLNPWPLRNMHTIRLKSFFWYKTIHEAGESSLPALPDSW